MGELPTAPSSCSVKWDYGFYRSHGTAVRVTQGAQVARPDPRQTLAKGRPPAPRPARPQGLAPPGASPRIRTRSAGRRPPGLPPVPGPWARRPRAPCRRPRPPRARAPARARARRRAVRPGTSLRPAPGLAPRLEREGPHRRSATRPPRLPAPGRTRRKPRSVRCFPGCGSRPQAHGAASPSARPTQPRGGVWPPPDQSASLAAATSRLLPAPSRGYPRGRRETPGATNKSAASGPVRPQGGEGDFRVGSPGSTLVAKVQPPLPKEQMDWSQASRWAVKLLFRLSRER